MSKSETVVYKNGKATYEVKVVEANAELGMWRTMMQDAAIAAENGEEKDMDLRAVSRRILHTVLYPSMIAASEPVRGFKDWPISFDEYKTLPEPFVIEWEAKVFSLNPHWQPKVPETKVEADEQEKKVLNSSPES